MTVCPEGGSSASTRVSSLHLDTIAATHIPHSRPRSTPIIPSHIILQHEIRTLFVCASQREVQYSAFPSNFAGYSSQNSSHLVSQRSPSTGCTQECAWVRRRTQDQPRTNETASSAARPHSQSSTAAPLNNEHDTNEIFYRCAQCGADPEAYTRSTDSMAASL